MAASTSSVLNRRLKQIASPAKRTAASFRRRVSSLKKKAMELRTLCDLPVLLSCFSTTTTTNNNNNNHQIPTTYPEDGSEVLGLIHRYCSIRPDSRAQYRHDLAGFMKKTQLIPRVEEEEEYCCCRVRGGSISLDGLSPEELWELDGFLEARLAAIEARIRLLATTGCNQSVVAPPVVQLQEQREGREEGLGNDAVPPNTADMPMESVASDDPLRRVSKEEEGLSCCYSPFNSFGGGGFLGGDYGMLEQSPGGDCGGAVWNIDVDDGDGDGGYLFLWEGCGWWHGDGGRG